ncbi:MAG: DUF2345 domain-containing protein [Gammaproteobacteria bacterium]|nr:DUF2345 domain-containing protein [Gammaproteobacteria bacterium]MDH5802717.1 DUF2345 domain-containing protein [Gammaproteobacteria bacterium]
MKSQVNKTGMHKTSTKTLESEPLMEVLNKPVRSSYRVPIHQEDNQSFNGTVIGEIIALEDSNGTAEVFVTYPNSPYRSPLLALTTVDIRKSDLGKHVALSFDQADPSRPIIMGIIKNSQRVKELELDSQDQALSASLDGDVVALNADKEIVLKCGKSSITLTKAGKIIIRGEYIVSRSTGVNSIKGGSVKIN